METWNSSSACDLWGDWWWKSINHPISQNLSRREHLKQKRAPVYELLGHFQEFHWKPQEHEWEQEWMFFFGKNSNRDPLFSNMWGFLRGNFVALGASALQSSAKGCQVLIQAHLAILLGCPNSYWGLHSRELYPVFTCGGPAWWCTPLLWLEVLAGPCIWDLLYECMRRHMSGTLTRHGANLSEVQIQTGVHHFSSLGLRLYCSTSAY